MIRLAIAAVLIVCATQEIAAQSARAAEPRLKELVTVTSDLIRVGDLVHNAGPHAQTAVFRAPDLGQTGTVAVARVIEALRPYDLAAIDTGGLSDVVVTRLSRTIGGREIEQRIAKVLAGRHGFGDQHALRITFDREPRTIHLETSVTAELDVSRINADPRSGRFDVQFEIPGSTVARRVQLRFTGVAVEMVETATLTRTVQRGEVLRAADVAMEQRPKAASAGEGFAAEQTIGLAAKRTLRAGQIIRQGDLAKPDVVHRGESVVIVYEIPGIVLTMRGKAMEAGAVGEVINVQNVQSNRTVQATITGPGRVIITATVPRSAAAAPSNTALAAAQ